MDCTFLSIDPLCRPAPTEGRMDGRQAAIRLYDLLLKVPYRKSLVDQI